MIKSLVKLIAIYCIRSVLVVLRIFFPIKNNRIIFDAYLGRQYACNPKYISEYLMKHYPDKYELVWAFKHVSEYRYLGEKGIKVVPYVSLRRLYYEMTAKFSINNNGVHSWMPYKKSQIRINTWHGGGCYKRVGIGEEYRDYFFKKIMQMCSDNTTYMLASSRYIEETVYPNDFDFHGTVLKTGMPRNDILVNGSAHIYSKVHKKLAVEGKRILLFAPTWRYDDETVAVPDFERVIHCCKKRFGGEWAVLYRAHQCTNKLSNVENGVDATAYPDMQELLLAVDVLVSDYSSCIWDFSLQKECKPCFLYTPDLNKYQDERGFHRDIYEWGFPVCTTEKELEDAVISFDYETFSTAMEKHHNVLGSYETGEACRRVSALIKELCSQ